MLKIQNKSKLKSKIKQKKIRIMIKIKTCQFLNGKMLKLNLIITFFLRLLTWGMLAFQANISLKAFKQDNIDRQKY